MEIASEVLTSTARTIWVNRKAAEVRERYKSLTMFHVQYVLRCMSETAVKIRNRECKIKCVSYQKQKNLCTLFFM